MKNTGICKFFFSFEISSKTDSFFSAKVFAVSLFALLFLLSTFSVSFSQVTFQRTFGNSANLNSNKSTNGMHGSAFTTSDGGYALVGSFGVSSTDDNVMLVKMNSDASLYWVKAIGNAAGDDDNGYSGIQTSDGGYAIVGGYYPAGTENLYIIKTTSDGSISWTKRYASASAGHASAYSIIQTTDDGYLIGGSARTGASGTGSDMYMIKLSSDGTNQWSMGYSGTSSNLHDYGYQAIETTDGGYVIIGQVMNTGGLDYDVFLIKTNNAGTPQWTNAIRNTTGNQTDIGYSVVQAADGGYVITGQAGSSNDILLMKLDNTGAFLWSNTYDPNSTNSEGRSVKETPDGGFIVAGSRSSSNVFDLILMKTSSSGSHLWTKVFSGTSSGTDPDAYGSSVVVLADGGFLVSGYRDNEPGGNDILTSYLIKTDSDGMTTSSTCPTTSSVTPTVTARTATVVVNTQTATVSFSSITSGGTASAPTITAKNPCNNSTTLPVEMMEFRGECEKTNPLLRWVTATELNNDHFLVERSMNGSSFEIIGKMPGAGTSNSVHEYTFTDDQPISSGEQWPELRFYRLRQVDHDGQHEYFGPIPVKCDPGEITITPSVSSGFYSISGDLRGATVSVYSLLGQNVFIGNNLLLDPLVDISREQSGVYFIKVTTPFSYRVYKVIKQ